MNKRWFAVILTVGLLLCLVPLSAFALNGDCITDSDGNILGWEDLTDSDLTDSDPVDMVWEQAPAPRSTASDTPTQPHPPAETNDVQNSAAADSSEVQMTSAESEFNTDELYADELYPDELYPDELYAVSAVDDSASTTEPDVCKIGDTTYTSLQEAIDKASPNDQIDLLQDITLETGLTFYSKNLTISGGGTRTLTLNQNGMYASHSDITFEYLTLNIYAHTHTYAGGAGGTANLISNSNLRLNNVNMTLSPDANCGSSMFLYQDTNLYLDSSHVVIKAVNGSMVDGIMADNSEYAGPNREIQLINSYVSATGCSHAGLMIDPIDLTMISSEIVVTQNGNYGLGCYDGKVTMISNSKITARNNDTSGWRFGVYIGALDMDATSTLEAYSNGGSGLGLGSPHGIEKSYIRGRIICEDNGANDPGAGGGLYVYAYDDGVEVYKGDVTIEDGAYVSLSNNVGLSGIQNSWILKIESGANVFVDNNASDGIYNSYDARLTIEGGAHVSISGNGEHGIENVPQGSMGLGDFVIKSGANVTINNNQLSGIFNRNIFTVEPGANLEIKGNASSGIINDFDATLNLGSGVVQCNNATATTYYWNNNWIAVGQKGGGIRNLGIANLSDDVQLYNNHALTAGDDIYNSADATITFGDTGKGWALDGGPDCYDDIDGWYDDSANSRWNAHAEDEADLHTVQVKPGTFNSVLALKAAHPTIGTLIISKAIAGALEPDDCGTDFNFVLTLADSSITTTDAEKYGVVFEDGKAAFTLKDSESITIANLPDGMSYTLAEQSKGGWRLAWVDGDAEGVVSRHKAAAITFINEKLPTTGSLVISKQVTGDLNPEDADTVFHFVLTLDDNTLTTADAEEYGVAFESGWASFTLKGGESITISGLPAGVGYTIAETRQNGWTLQSVSGETTGVIPQNGTVEIAFVNQKNDGFIPVDPVDPVEPVLPVEPAEPVEPDMPAETETPAEPVTPEVPETPAQDKAPVPSQTPEAPAKADASVSTLPQTGTPGWMAMALLSFGCVLLACGWFLTRKQRREK